MAPGVEATLMAAGRLSVFTRYPEPQKTKTRLIGALGPVGAAFLQEQMTRRILSAAAGLARRRPCDVEVRYEGATVAQMRRMFGGRFRFVSQGQGNLGARMAHAFEAAYREGARAFVIVGSDCPGVDASLLQRAFEVLGSSDVVLGPASDGGYYLIGARKPRGELFTDIKWGTSGVCAATIERARAAGLSVCLLDVLHDVDREEDLPVWTACTGRRVVGRLSVVVAALNEEAHIEKALSIPLATPDVETIVVDGGSSDATVDIAASSGARVCSTPPGRGRQMNAGAAQAAGDALLFLHADSFLPEGFDRCVREILSMPGVAGGAFRFSLGRDDLVSRFYEAAVNFRARVGQLPYGDQALFLKRDIFKAIGAFPETEIMEDFALVNRLRREGRIAVAKAPVVTSDRRWRKRGAISTILINQLVVAGYLLGVPASRLGALYRGRPRGSGQAGKGC